jgi:hypothetical protein
MELIVLSGAATLGLLIVHLLDFLLEPLRGVRTRLEAPAHEEAPLSAVPARSLDITEQLDRAA